MLSLLDETERTMKRRVTALVLNLALLGSSLPALSQGHASNRAPVIKHTPITLAAPGQSITIRARVTDDAAKVKAVTLFYATSRDAAPFRTPMSSAGQDSFLGTIPATQLAGISNVSY